MPILEQGFLPLFRYSRAAIAFNIQFPLLADVREMSGHSAGF